MPCSVWDLSSPTKDRIQVPCVCILTTGLPRKSFTVIILNIHCSMGVRETANYGLFRILQAVAGSVEGGTMKWCIRGEHHLITQLAGRSACHLECGFERNNYERTTYGNPSEGRWGLGLQEQKWRQRGMETFRVCPGGGVDWHVKRKRKKQANYHIWHLNN